VGQLIRTEAQEDERTLTAPPAFLGTAVPVAPASKPPKAPAQPIDSEVIDLLGAAWKAASRDDEGYARLQEIGQIAGNRSSFDVRNHGFKRLSDLIRASEQFELKRNAQGQPVVRRLR
jgi:hypothetical protein